MTNAEAIKLIKEERRLLQREGDPEEFPGALELAEALGMAIKALEAQEWITCNPLELPKDKKLWVTHDRWGCRYVDEVYWDMTEWSDNISDVVAYTPYVEPEPYKENT